MKTKGMPLGNHTSQFFANVYLHELDWFVKHTLKAKHYIRYVDDFVILHHQKHVLRRWQKEIEIFLQQRLLLTLHPQKQNIREINQGVAFLGFRIFPHHTLLRKGTIRAFHGKRGAMMTVGKDATLYDILFASLDGWIAYAKHADTYILRKKMTGTVQRTFLGSISLLEIDRWSKTMRSISSKRTISHNQHTINRQQNI